MNELELAPRPDVIPFIRTEEVSKYQRRITYAVHGFWGGDNVNVSQHIDWLTTKWAVPTINWSCGGREPKQEPDDIVAAECFGRAIADAVKVARKWRRAMEESISVQTKHQLNKERTGTECILDNSNNPGS